MATVVRYKPQALILGDQRLKVDTSAFDDPALFRLVADAGLGSLPRLLRRLLPADSYAAALAVVKGAHGRQADNLRALINEIFTGECPELMTLMYMAHKCRAALDADFRRFYQTDLEAAWETMSPRRLANWAANLPMEGAVHRTLNPDWQWSLNEQLLAGVYDQLSYLRWEGVKIAGGKPGKAPDQMERPGVTPKKDVEVVGASEGFDSMEDFDAVYAEIKARMKPAPE